MEGNIPWGLPKRRWKTVGIPESGLSCQREAASFAQFLHFFPQESDHPQTSNAPEISLTIPHAK